MKCEQDFGIKIIYRDKIIMYHLKKLLKNLKRYLEKRELFLFMANAKEKHLFKALLKNYVIISIC
ncbi:TPA: hypothetical protein ACXDU9_002588 [Clostridioides difficile]|nr:hypothetical protein [Clostridioides difficile]HEL3037671.1 hypothetical protein [Clostridioides difficile]